MSTEQYQYERGVYNLDYYSGAQVAVYIGDVWVDEITSMSYSVSQSRVPLYGYASELFDDVSRGNVLVQGQFTINFKEAGYLWLILNRYTAMLRLTQMSEKQYQRYLKRHPGVAKRLGIVKEGGKFINILTSGSFQPFLYKNQEAGENIEQIINGEANINEVNSTLQNLAAQASLTGFSGITRQSGLGGGGQLGLAEDLFETFEDRVWGTPQAKLDQEHRRADDSALNPFDIYLNFGDFTGNDTVNHTIQKISDVHIIGSSKQIVIDGQPIQEAYSFIGRNLV